MFHFFKVTDQDQVPAGVYSHSEQLLDKQIFGGMCSLSLKSEHFCIMIYWFSALPPLMGRPSAFPSSVTQCRCWEAGAGATWSSSIHFYKSGKIQRPFPKPGLYLAIGARPPFTVL